VGETNVSNLDFGSALRSPTVQIHLPIHHICHLAPFAKELHHFLARACRLRPPGFGLGLCSSPRISFPSNTKSACRSPRLGVRSNGKTFRAEFDGTGVFVERLLPNINERLFKGQSHRTCLEGDYMQGRRSVALRRDKNSDTFVESNQREFPCKPANWQNGSSRTPRRLL
jgi:hypothetical protein